LQQQTLSVTSEKSKGDRELLVVNPLVVAVELKSYAKIRSAGNSRATGKIRSAKIRNAV
jgi:hypothetical protein